MAVARTTPNSGGSADGGRGGSGMSSFLPTEINSWIERATNSFDESFKQFQTAYGSTNDAPTDRRGTSGTMWEGPDGQTREGQVTMLWDTEDLNNDLTCGLGTILASSRNSSNAAVPPSPPPPPSRARGSRSRSDRRHTSASSTAGTGNSIATVTRTKSYVGQPVGVDFMTIETKRHGTLLVVSRIHPSSIFVSTDLQVGDAIVGINGVSFGVPAGPDHDDDEHHDHHQHHPRYGSAHTRTSVTSSSSTTVYKPDVDLAYRLLDRGGSDSTLRDHRGRSPGRSRNDLRVTLEYRRLDDVDVLPASLPRSSPGDNTVVETTDTGHHRDVVLASSSFSTATSTTTTTTTTRSKTNHHPDDETTVTTSRTDRPNRDDAGRPQRSPNVRSVAAAAAAAEVGTTATKATNGIDEDIPSRSSTAVAGGGKQRQEQEDNEPPEEPRSRKMPWGPARAFLNRARNGKDRTPTKGRQSLTTKTTTTKTTTARTTMASGTKIIPPHSPPIEVIHHPQVQPSSSAASAAASASASTSTHSTRLAELRARNQRLRESSHERLETSKRRLSSISTHIEVTTTTTNNNSVRPSHRPSLKEPASCDSPDHLARQMKDDQVLIDEMKKRRFDEKVQKFKQELLSGIQTHQQQQQQQQQEPEQQHHQQPKEWDRIVQPWAAEYNDTSEDEANYKLARSQQEQFIASVQKLTNDVSTSLDTSLDTSSPSRIDAGSRGGQTPTRNTDAVTATGSTSPSPPRRKLVLLDDSSWSTVDRFEGSPDRRANTAHILEEHHEEITRLNRKVTDKLRSKVDLLKRSNMKLSEDIAILRRNDTEKAFQLKSYMKQLDEVRELEGSLKRELELCKSRYNVLTMQADKRQKELMKEIERQKLISNDRVETLVGRISSLERVNRRLMNKCHAAVTDQCKVEEMKGLVARMKKRLSDQGDRIDQLTLQKRDLEQDLERALTERDSSMEAEICHARTAFLEGQLEDLKEQLKVEKERRQACQRTLIVALRKYKGMEEESDKSVLSEPTLLMSTEAPQQAHSSSREHISNDSDTSHDAVSVDIPNGLDSAPKHDLPVKDRSELIARLKEKAQALKFESRLHSAEGDSWK